jgi:hypothetical protein
MVHPGGSRGTRSSGDPYQRTTVHLRREQHRALRIRAAELGRDVSEIIRELVDRFLRETEGQKRP